MWFLFSFALHFVAARKFLKHYSATTYTYIYIYINNSSVKTHLFSRRFAVEFTKLFILDKRNFSFKDSLSRINCCSRKITGKSLKFRKFEITITLSAMRFESWKNDGKTTTCHFPSASAGNDRRVMNYAWTHRENTECEESLSSRFIAVTISRKNRWIYYRRQLFRRRREQRQ